MTEIAGKNTGTAGTILAQKSDVAHAGLAARLAKALEKEKLLVTNVFSSSDNGL